MYDKTYIFSNCFGRKKVNCIRTQFTPAMTKGNLFVFFLFVRFIWLFFLFNIFLSINETQKLLLYGTENKYKTKNKKE